MWPTVRVRGLVGAKNCLNVLQYVAMKSALLKEFLEFKFLANNFAGKLRSYRDRNNRM